MWGSAETSRVITITLPFAAEKQKSMASGA
jgi:hypothetical protein